MQSTFATLPDLDAIVIDRSVHFLLLHNAMTNEDLKKVMKDFRCVEQTAEIANGL